MKRTYSQIDFDIEAANAFLQAFTTSFNENFSKVPARPRIGHGARSAARRALQARAALCRPAVLILYGRKQIILEKNDISCGCVDLYEFADGCLGFGGRHAPCPALSSTTSSAGHKNPNCIPEKLLVSRF
ncbi:hypothetical protein NKH36_12115 [Mesorhizobium sp. M1312]|uniref:hypothetical protein n=1 Tax=unclassified Mesorhizobium TaxID=325217 RepID=UPI00333D9D46